MSDPVFLIAAIVLGLLSLVAVYLLLSLRGLRREYAALHEQLAEANASLGTSAPEVRSLLENGAGTAYIAIEILNPMQLAAKQNWLADKFGSLTPALVRRLVYERAKKITLEMLANQGAEAHVSIVRR